MPEENLHSAARRILRWINIDLNSGGLISQKTEEALLTLEKEVEKENKRLKALEPKEKESQ